MVEKRDSKTAVIQAVDIKTANSFMWGIRLATLTVGGSVSMVAIAALVTAVPTPADQKLSTASFSDNPDAAVPSLSKIPLSSSVPSTFWGSRRTLPPIYPLQSPITPTLSSSPTITSNGLTSRSLSYKASDPNHLAFADANSDTIGRHSQLGDGPIDRNVSNRSAIAVSQSKSDNITPYSTRSPDEASPLNNASDFESSSDMLPLRLQDVVILTLENNRTIKNAYLDRIIQQESLWVAEDQFNPNITPRVTLNARRNDQGLSTTTAGDIEVGTTIDVLLPSGTQLSAGWTALGDAQNTIGRNRNSSDGLGQQLSVRVTHPLWRNAGEAVTRSPLRIARLQEEQNIFGLQTTLINTITDASRIYFDLVLAQRQLEIEEAGLVRTENELDRINALIEVGRTAASQRVEAEADVANRQVEVLAAKNRLQDAQLSLVQALDIEATLIPVATESNVLSEEQIRFDQDKGLVDYALAQNPEYRSQLLNLDVAHLELLQAEDQLGWDLDLVMGYTNDLSSRSAERSEARASLELSRELGDRALKQRVVSQRTRIEQLENNQTEARENLEIRVRDAIRNVDFQQTQVEQAKRATQLAQQQLDITQTQFRQGKETFLDVVQAQDRLVSAQNQELSAQIGYQNALLSLDQELGHTLETWNIQVRTIDLPD
ncbi:MAG: TolC family protein [Cyanobacteria bacterium P01_F01_bin.150]